MVMNNAGPFISNNQSQRWLLFNREISNQTESDVSDVISFPIISSLMDNIYFFVLISI